MELNRGGEIGQKCWLEIPDHFDIIELDDFVIMPNHVHGIIIIHDVGDVHGRPLRRQHMLLSTVVQHYKAAVSKWVHRMGESQFRWQRSFFDHIIRNDFSLFKIRTYIQNNPLKWEYDRENQNGISLANKNKFWGDFLREQL